MAKIGLYDVDGHNWPNLPLMKLSAWHKAQGDDVERLNRFMTYDRVYKSKVYDFTAEDDTVIQADEIVAGGTGYGLDNDDKSQTIYRVLPDDVEHIYPDYGLYGVEDVAYGFLTRGCPRRCPFCIVSEKEGARSVKVAELSEFWRGQQRIKLLDPNLLAAPEADDLLVRLAQSRTYIDFTQGLDVRLLDETRAALIKAMRIQTIHFAWDDPKQDLTPQFAQVKKWLGYNARKLAVYVLTNYDSTHDEDLYRVETLRRLGFDPYVMICDKDSAPRMTRLLQRYVNNKIIFGSCGWAEYDCKIG